MGLIKAISGAVGGVLADHVARIDAAVRGQKCRQTVRQRRIDHAFEPPLRNGGKLRGGNAEVIHNERNGFSVEVAAAENALVL